MRYDQSQNEVPMTVSTLRTVCIEKLAGRVPVDPNVWRQSHGFAAPEEAGEVRQPHLIARWPSRRAHHSNFHSSLSKTSLRPVSVQSLSAKAWSCTWKRSLTLTASPRLGLPGVVVSDSVRRKET